MITLIFLLLSLPVYAVGALVIWHVARPQRPPADPSNRINKIRLIWLAMTREGQFADHFPWVRRDEKDNVDG